VRRLMIVVSCCAGLGFWPVASTEASPAPRVDLSSASAPRPPAPQMSLASPFASTRTPSVAQVELAAASRTKFEGLRREAAVSLAERDFHIGEPAWTAPGAGEGARVERYLGRSSVAEKLPGGRRWVGAGSRVVVFAR
jgi:hypothetical protein